MLNLLISITALLTLIGLITLFLGKSTRTNVLGNGSARFGKWCSGLSAPPLVLFVTLWIFLPAESETPPTLPPSNRSNVPSTNNGTGNGGAMLVNGNATPAKSQEEKLLDLLQKEVPYVTSLTIENLEGEEVVEVIYSFPNELGMYPTARIPGYYQYDLKSMVGESYWVSINGQEPIPIHPKGKTKIEWKDVMYKTEIGPFLDDTPCEIRVIYRKFP